jgi:hypothetical protein
MIQLTVGQRIIHPHLMNSLKLKEIITPEIGLFVDICPNCGSSSISENTKCQCGYRNPKSLVLSYNLEWDYTDTLIEQFSEYGGLRLMGKYKGKQPDQLSRISHVEYLYLSRYTGLNPHLFQDFKRLKTLEIDYAMIPDLNGIEILPMLRVLELTECRKLIDIGALALMPKLLGLRMALCNSIRDYSALDQLRELRVLTLEAKQVPSLSFLKELLSLRELTLPIDRVEDGNIPDLSNLVNLRQVAVPNKKWSKPLIEAIQKQLPHCDIHTF